MKLPATEDDAGYCKVFVDGISRDDLLGFLAKRLAARRVAFSVFADEMIVDVRHNDEADASRANESADGFLFYPVILDIEPVDGVDRDRYVQRVGRLLNELWSEGRQAIAACDFEDELPRRGGYTATA